MKWMNNRYDPKRIVALAVAGWGLTMSSIAVVSSASSSTEHTLTNARTSLYRLCVEHTVTLSGGLPPYVLLDRCNAWMNHDAGSATVVGYETLNASEETLSH